MKTKHKLTPKDKEVIIACIIAFIFIPIIGPFIYLFIADCFASHERKLKLLSAIGNETQKSKELSAQLEHTLTTIKYLKQKISAYENRASSDKEYPPHLPRHPHNSLDIPAGNARHSSPIRKS